MVQFISVRTKLNPFFRLTLRGVVSDLSDMLLTQTDSSKRTFNIVDDAGMWIRCCALGMVARSRALANGNEIVVYYGAGRKSLGSAPGMVYLLKDSLVVQVGQRTVVPVKRTEIPIDGE